MVQFSTHAHPTHFASDFGGLWTDVSNAKDVVAGRLALNDITQEEADLLLFWIENGYVILKGAVSREVVSEVNQTIDALYEREIGFAETYDSGEVRVVPLQRRHRGTWHKLIDGYASSRTILDAIMAERVVRFLNIVFNSPALAFQGLYFEHGSEQPIHQDTAYVRVSRPMELAASWLALEDIKADSGELEYYPGSHRLPDFKFEGNAKWLPPDGSQHDAYLKYLHDESARMGLKKQRFLAKAGDILIWSADLAHGGSPIKDRTTRRSFVTHWCPVTVDPAYFYYPPHSGRIRYSDRASYAYSYHGAPADPFTPMDTIVMNTQQTWSSRLKSLVSRLR